MTGISEWFDYATEKKEFRNLKDAVSKLISNSYIYDVKRKGCKKDNKKKIVMLKEKAIRKILIKKKTVMIAKMLIMIMIMIAKMLIMIMIMIKWIMIMIMIF